MPRSEAQKEADKRYAKKVQGRYMNFVVHLLPDEYAQISKSIADAGMGKAEFLRWAVAKLDKEEK